MARLADTSLFGDANLQAYYKLEDVSDSKGANTLTNNNTVTFTAAKFTNGANLGSTDANKCLSVASALGYANGAYSVSLWVKLNTELTGADTVYQICNIYTTTSQWLLNYSRVGGVNALNFTRFDGATLEGPSYNVTLGTTDFHHIVMTHDGTSIRGYLDNALVGGPTTATGQTGSYSAVMTLGSNGNDITANNALVILDDAGFFNRELTAAEVTTLFTPSVTGGSFLFNFI